MSRRTIPALLVLALALGFVAFVLRAARDYFRDLD